MHAQVEYVQSGLAPRIEDAPQNNRLRWVLDPRRSGLALVMSAIGCHAQHLASFAVNRRVTSLCADAISVVPDRKVIDTVSALLRFEGGLAGTFTAIQAAAGSENDIRLRIYGANGMLGDWSHREPSYLKIAMLNEGPRVAGRGDASLPPEIVALGRAPRGHPEKSARGVRQHLRGARAGAHAAHAGRAGAGVPLPDDRGRRAHDGVHRGVHRVAGALGRRGGLIRAFFPGFLPAPGNRGQAPLRPGSDPAAAFSAHPGVEPLAQDDGPLVRAARDDVDAVVRLDVEAEPGARRRRRASRAP